MQPPGPQFLPPGTVLGKYEIVRGLAVGGMAELYLARMRAMGSVQRLVALKRILPNYACEQEFVHMFLDEARLTAKLQHPNIGQVFDIGTSELGLFFTMEYISGENARTLLRTAARRGERIPLGQALSIVIQIARGLHHAHEQRGTDGESLGVVHRDVSPSNVIVSFDGVAKLIDFGVAKARGRFSETRTGVVKGKISYMSPEQCQGEEIDGRSDVFALGILLYELTTNLRLYKAANEFMILRRIIDEDAPPPSQQVLDYPLALEGIVMRALARDLNERYQSAADLADALTAFVAENGLDSSTESLAGYMHSQFSDSIRAWQNTVTQLASQPRPLGKRGWRQKSRVESKANASWTMRAPSPQIADAADGTPNANGSSQTSAYADLYIDVLDCDGPTEVSAPLVTRRRWRWSPGVAIGAIAALAALVAVAAAQSGEPVAASRAALVTESNAPIPDTDTRRAREAAAPVSIADTASEGESAATIETDDTDSADTSVTGPVAPEVATVGDRALSGASEGDAKARKKSRKDRRTSKKNRRSKRAKARARARQAKRASRTRSAQSWDPDAALPP